MPGLQIFYAWVRYSPIYSSILDGLSLEQKATYLHLCGVVDRQISRHR